MKIQSVVKFLRIKNFGFKYIFRYNNSDLWRFSTRKEGLKLSEHYHADTIIDLRNKEVVKSLSSNYNFWEHVDSMTSVVWSKLA